MTSPEDSNLGQRWWTANRNIPTPGFLRLQAEVDVKYGFVEGDGQRSSAPMKIGRPCGCETGELRAEPGAIGRDTTGASTTACEYATIYI